MMNQASTQNSDEPNAIAGHQESDKLFSEEIAATRQNKELMDLLEERSKEPGKYTLAEVRQHMLSETTRSAERGRFP
jgi:hypothetical protein